MCSLVRFRPHFISTLEVSGGYYDDRRDYHEGTESWSELMPCRYEPNGKARTVPVGEGRDYRYEYVVYMNQDCPQISYGQKVRLYDASQQLIGDYEVKGFHRGQLDAKVWL